MPVSKKRKAAVTIEYDSSSSGDERSSRVENAKKKKRLSLAERKALVRARVDKWAAVNTSGKSPPSVKPVKSSTKTSSVPTNSSLGKSVASSKISDLSKTPKWTKKEKLAQARAKAALWNQQQKELKSAAPETTVPKKASTSKTAVASKKKMEIARESKIPKASSSSRRKSVATTAAATTTRRRTTRRSLQPTSQNYAKDWQKPAVSTVSEKGDGYSTGDSDMESISKPPATKAATKSSTANNNNKQDGYSTGDSDMESVVDLRATVDPAKNNLPTVVEQKITSTSSSNIYHPLASTVTNRHNITAATTAASTATKATTTTTTTTANDWYAQPKEKQSPYFKTNLQPPPKTENFMSPLAPSHITAPPTFSSSSLQQQTTTAAQPPIAIPPTSVAFASAPEIKSVLLSSNVNMPTQQQTSTSTAITSHLQEINQPSYIVDNQKQYQLPDTKQEYLSFHKFQTPKKLSSVTNDDALEEISPQQQQISKGYRRGCRNLFLFLSFFIAFLSNIIVVYLVLDWTAPYWKLTTQSSSSPSITPSSVVKNIQKKIPTVITATKDKIKNTNFKKKKTLPLCFQNTIDPGNDNKNESDNINDYSHCLPCPTHGICENHQLVSCEYESFYELIPTKDNGSASSIPASCQLSKSCQEVWTNIQQQLEQATLSHWCSVPLSQQKNSSSSTTTVYRSITDLDWEEQYDTCYHLSILSHYNLILDSPYTASNEIDNVESIKIGLSNSHVKENLSLPWSCYFQLLCKQLLWIFVVQLPMYGLRILFVQLTTNPKRFFFILLGGYIGMKILTKYRHRQYVKEQVRLVREEVRNLLIQDKLQSSQLQQQQQQHQEPEGCAVLHMRDHIGHLHYPDDVDKRVKFLYKQVWPKVEQDINADNRIAKSVKCIPNKGHMHWWTWIATTSSTPNHYHRSNSNTITPKNTKQE